MTRVTPRLLAFYLPQFHPIPENDRWWGDGFTEWTNVRRAQPLFEGHMQPAVPGELGYYDLRSSEAREAQAALARAHGITGFCYYHYWFNGRRLLGGVLDEVLAQRQPDFPFCLCWANESWTRRWDGLDHDVLIRQTYGPEDDRRHIRWLAKVFADPRYIRVAGCPLLLVYRASRLPSAIRTASVWREELKRLGFDGLYLCAVEGLAWDRLPPSSFGFDAAVEFQPDWKYLGSPTVTAEGDSAVFDYATIVARMLERPRPPYVRFPCVTTGWDNSPRRRQNAVVLCGSTPQLYGQWLARVIDESAFPSAEENFVFVNAWNEWGEGAHLEPSARWGRAYLEMTRDVLGRGGVRIVAPPLRAVAHKAARVTVAIPTCNGASYIEEAVQSVLAQAFTDFELVVIDDCSDDGTVAIVSRFNDSRIRVETNAFRQGLVGNWNRCLESATGEYVTIFHQDDVMDPKNLAQKVRLLDSHPAVAFVHSNVRQIGPRGEVLSNAWYAPPGPGDGGVHAGRAFLERLFHGENLVCCPTVMLRREMVFRHGLFDTHLPFTADWEMWMRLSLFHDVAYSTDHLVSYRRHASAETERFRGVDGLEQCFMAKQRILDKYGSYLPAHEWRARAVDQYVSEAARRAQDAAIEGRLDDANALLALVARLRADADGNEQDNVEWTGRLLMETATRAASSTAERLAQRELEVETLRTREAELEAAVTAFRRSASWRITAPLRLVFRVLTGRSH